MTRVLAFIAYIGFVAYCISDVLYREERRPYGLHKAWWITVIVLVPVFGPAGWLFAKFRGGPAAAPPGPSGRAPDDDPEYLAWLRDQERRRRQQRDNG